MRVCITIGYQQFLLPTDANLPALLKALAKATPIRDYDAHGHKIILRGEDDDEMTVKAEYVADNASYYRYIDRGNGSMERADAPGQVPRVRLAITPRRMLTVGS